jgi:hypothetical protein
VKDAVLMPRERALLDGQVVDDVNAVDLDARVREGVEPAGVERDAGRLSSPRIPPGATKTTSSASTSANALTS